MNILLVYPEFSDTFWSFKYALKFINRKAANPPLGLVTIAAMLPKEWNLKLVDMNVSTLTDDQIIWSDYVFISAMTVQRVSVNALIHRCHSLNRKIVAGGPLFTCEPDNFPAVDHLVLNEGEITIPRFIEDMNAGHLQKSYAAPEYPDIHTTPIPRFELLELEKYDCMCVQYSRGCPFHCEFCNVTALNGHTPRIKSREQFIAELDYLYKIGWNRNIFVVDDNFIGNKRYLKSDILPALIDWRKDKQGIHFITEVSVNLADDEELMTLMSNAGFTSIFVGIETPSEDGLNECHKSQNTRRNLLDSVHNMQSHGMQVMAGFIVGFDSDTPAIFQQQFDFIQDSGIITAMVGLLQAPMGTELYSRMEKNGRIRTDFTGDNTDGESNIIPLMDGVLLRQGYVDLMRKLFSPEVAYQRIRTMLKYFVPRNEPVKLTMNDILALFRTIYGIGIMSNARKEYWKLIFWTLTHYPEKFPLAVTMAVYAYHFNLMSTQHVHGKEKATSAVYPGINTSRQTVPARH
jgi:radical SAM superfamily enzyme YgiQ (UPF0313 family)